MGKLSESANIKEVACSAPSHSNGITTAINSQAFHVELAEHAPLNVFPWKPNKKSPESMQLVSVNKRL